MGLNHLGASCITEYYSEHILEHRLKYYHGAVRKVAVHLEANIQRLILVLMDGHSIYQHSEVRIGYAALGEYVVEQH